MKSMYRVIERRKNYAQGQEERTFGRPGFAYVIAEPFGQNEQLMRPRGTSIPRKSLSCLLFLFFFFFLALRSYKYLSGGRAADRGKTIHGFNVAEISRVVTKTKRKVFRGQFELEKKKEKRKKNRVCRWILWKNARRKDLAARAISAIVFAEGAY